MRRLHRNQPNLPERDVRGAIRVIERRLVRRELGLRRAGWGSHGQLGIFWGKLGLRRTGRWPPRKLWIRLGGKLWVRRTLNVDSHTP